MSEKTKVIGYIRVSTDEQAREGFSLDNQRKDIAEFCKYKGWELLDIFSDEGISGAGMNERIGLLKALKLIQNKNIDYLVVWKLSRLSRKVADVVKITERLDNNNTYLVSIKDNIDTSSPMGKPFLYIASIFAEMERDSMIVQVKGGMAEKAREGRWNGGISPLGYDLVNKELVINEAEAEIVKKIYSDYLKGEGYKTIAKNLNDKGYKTRKDFPFSGNSIKDILRNPTYAGKIRWGKLKNWGKKNADGERKREYNDDMIIVDGIHQAIIDLETFKQVQELIEGNPRHHVKRFTSNHILSGLLRCPGCGSGMSIQRVKNKGNTYFYYSCNQYANKKTCKPNLIPQESIEDEFFEILERIINEDDFMGRILSSLNNSSNDIAEKEKAIAKKETELKKLRIKEDKLFDELLEGDEKYKEKIRTRIQENDTSISSIEREIKELLSDIDILKDKKVNVTEIADLLKQAGKVIKLMDKDTQKRLIRKLISSIDVEEKHIKAVHFSFDEGFGIERDTENRIISNGGFLVYVSTFSHVETVVLIEKK